MTLPILPGHARTGGSESEGPRVSGERPLHFYMQATFVNKRECRPSLVYRLLERASKPDGLPQVSNVILASVFFGAL